ncbi:MAG: hypothetical protein U0T74_03830 [Chitinophagales bacterium]
MKKKQELADQYAAFALIKKANKGLEKLARYNPEDAVYGGYILDAMDVPSDVALKIAKSPNITE